MRTTRIVATAVAAGLVGAGLVGVPAVLAADSPSPTSSGARWADGWADSWGDGDGDGRPGGPMMAGAGMGAGFGAGMGGAMMQGRGRGPGAGSGWQRGPGMGRDDGPGAGFRGGCRGLLGGAAQGTLTRAQQQDLAAQAEVEKLSHDVYLAFADSVDDPRFEHIAWAETRHLAVVRTLLDRYDVTDPTAGDRVGEFDNDVARTAYASAVADGSGSLSKALDVAADLERTDIDGLEAAAQGLDAPDVERVYAHLTAASRMHLAMFSG